MCQELCRLCMSSDNLRPIFANVDQNERYTKVLSLTTGLEIKINDGFPQTICDDCTELVNSALNLRNYSHLTEMKLLFLNEQTKNNNKSGGEWNDEQRSDDKVNIEEHEEDSLDFFGFENLEDNQHGGELKFENAGHLPEGINKRKRRGDKKAAYLNLVDGVLDPKGPVKCRICKKSVSKWSCFTGHAKLHLGLKFICEFCGKRFKSLAQLQRHCRSYHGMQRELACKHCSYLALDNAQLVLHERRMHTGVRPYVCDICAASYFSRRCLIQHLETHRTDASVQCPQCPRVLKSRRHLSRHRYTAHATATAQCPICARSYSRRYLRSHITKYHSQHDVPSSTDNQTSSV